jgi:uncharacterized membrane protein YjjB (DUF3815 family)
MIIQVVAAYFVTIFFSIMFNTSKKQLFISGIVGALGWWGYLIMVHNGYSVVTGSFIGALIVSLLSFIFSRFRKSPVTIFQIPGIIPLVPGMGMYRTLYAVIDEDYSAVAKHLFETLQIAGSIAVAMMLVFSLRTVIDQQKALRLKK